MPSSLISFIRSTGQSSCLPHGLTPLQEIDCQVISSRSGSGLFMFAVVFIHLIAIFFSTVWYTFIFIFCEGISALVICCSHFWLKNSLSCFYFLQAVSLLFWKHFLIIKQNMTEIWTHVLKTYIKKPMWLIFNDLSGNWWRKEWEQAIRE